MDFSNLDKALAQDLDAFKKYIEGQLEQDERLLQKTFWNHGKMIDFLTYVIQKHDKEHNNLTEQMTFLLKKGANTSLNQPVHLVLKEKKLDLLPLLLKAKAMTSQESKQEEDAFALVNEQETDFHFDINGRDAEGRTILSRAVETGDLHCLQYILEQYQPLINQADNVWLEETSQTMQPLHLAVYRDFGEGVKALLEAGATLDSPFGHHKRPALSMAARLANVSALDAVLELTRQEQLDYQDALGLRPIDLLCDTLAKNEKPHEAIRGVAMLLCRGAETPRREVFCHLLQSHRRELIEEIINYAEKNPTLKPAILRTIHNKNTAFHRIVYDTHSLSRALKNITGGYDELAGRVESLADNIPEQVSEPLTADEKNFADFVKRYLSTIRSATFFNRWSGMLTKISQGEVTCWRQLTDYAYENPNSRTAMIVNEMRSPPQEIHLNLQ